MKPEQRQSLIAGIVAVFLVAPILWMAFDRLPPYVRISGSIEPDDPQPGSMITVRWRVREIRYCPYDFRRQVVRTIIDKNGIEHKYEPVPAKYTVDIEKEIVRDINLPVNITPGPARYRSEACYSCNPFQEFFPVCVSTPEISFNIAEPTEEPTFKLQSKEK